MNIICCHNWDYSGYRLRTFAELVLANFNVDVDNVGSFRFNNLIVLLEERGDAESSDIWSVILLLMSKGFNLQPYRQRVLWFLCLRTKFSLDQIIFFLRAFLLHLDVELNEAVKNANHPYYDDNILAHMLFARNANRESLSIHEEDCWEEIFHLFLEYGFNVNSVSCDTKETVLMVFCLHYRGKNFIRLLRMLLENGANVNASHCRTLCRFSQTYNKRINRESNRSNYRNYYWYAFDYFLVNKSQQHHLLEVYELFLHHGRKATDMELERRLLLNEFNASLEMANNVHYFINMPLGKFKRKREFHQEPVNEAKRTNTQMETSTSGTLEIMEKDPNSDDRGLGENQIQHLRKAPLYNNNREILALSIAFVIQTAISYTIADYFLNHLASRSSELFDSGCVATYEEILRVLVRDKLFIGVRAIINEKIKQYMPNTHNPFFYFDLKMDHIQCLKWPVICHKKFNDYLRYLFLKYDEQVDEFMLYDGFDSWIGGCMSVAKKNL